ncbi:MAG TPA: OmpA family protein [Phycisphaerales bacterium]|nr:OmpA family protein [Phycisphaerales bacterium]
MAEEHKDNHGGGSSHGSGHGSKGHGGGHGGGGGHEEAHEGAPEWLISFADNVALMMGFFVILLAMNMKDPTSGGIGGKDKNGGQPQSRMVDAAIAIREAFHSPVSLASTNPEDQVLIRRIKQKMGQSDSRDKAPKGDRDTVQSIRPGDYYRLGGSVMFEEGSSLLSNAAKEQIESVAEHVRGQKFIIELRGHVSAGEAYPSVEKGFELSFHRAQAVAFALNATGIKWNQIRIVAAGAGDRVAATEYRPDAFRTNQRCEIVVTEETRGDDPYSSDPAQQKAE